ncbi:MAG: DUF1549 and DUF1553 domain-containing protein [Candidatus Hinthialibacter antarcticus]|nr:DUF1549 and DUF1553 domain-containing protein [Candidatus Hinthialibacter antarcticus]
MLNRTGFAVTAIVVLTQFCFAAPLTLFPKTIHLSHADDRQQLLVLEMDAERSVADWTREAQLVVEDPNVARVEDGVIVPVGDGQSVVRVEVGGQTVTATVVVTGTHEPHVWSFAHDVQPAMTKIGCNAGACHGAAAGKNGFKLSLRGYDLAHDHNVLTRQAKGRRILISEPDNSLLLQKPVGDVPHGGGRLMRRESAEYRIIKEWIADKAPTPPADEKQLTGIDVFPKRVRMNAGEQQQLIVIARFDDGSQKDATPWSKYETTNDGVAVIDGAGLATIQRSGSAALTVWYNGMVAFSSVEVPYEEELSDEVFAQAERRNFIDEKILDQLQALRIGPSGPCSDAEFVRRAYLDAIGVLPTQREIVAFVMDADPDKRERLVNELVEREEFVDLWSYKWSDLLLVSTNNSGLNNREAALAYYRFIRDSVKQNIGWNEFVERIITAQGSTLDNGAANYFVLHKETTELVETTSKAFMGLSITCARCHNHPMEKWTQNDYYGMGNLLARVRLKNGDRAGETFVRSGSSGDMIHPLYGKPLPPKPLDSEAISLDADNRRAYLAEWLTSPENPYFARAIVNRVWKHFMGAGLVEPEDDLRLTNPPSNEALFTALEKDFVAHEYDVKHLVQTIMDSAAYQRSSKPEWGNDGDLRNYSRYFPRRLSAEIILDAYSSVTGADTQFAGYPQGWRALQLPDANAASQFLATFGRPERKQTCSCERDSTPTLAQALHISNGNTLNEKLQRDGNFIDQFLDGGGTLDDFIFDLYLQALCRTPSRAEKAAVIEAVMNGGDWDGMERKEKRLALEDAAWAVLSGKEFLFNH